MDKDGNRVREEEKSVDLLLELIDRFVIKTQATILDMFAGTATTALACINFGYQFVGCEKEAKCYELASIRLFDEYKKLDKRSFYLEFNF
jgi:DNA modification methylase